MTDAPHDHLDLDEAADFDEGLLDAAASARVAAQVASCPTCAATLDRITRAAAALRGLGPVEMPADVVARLEGSLAAEARSAQVPGGATTVTPLSSRRRANWAPMVAVAAGLAAVVGVGALLSHLGTSSSSRTAAAATTAAATSAAAADSAAAPAIPGAESGNDYGTGAATKLSALLAPQAERIKAVPSANGDFRVDSGGVSVGRDAAAGSVTDASTAAAAAATTEAPRPAAATAAPDAAQVPAPSGPASYAAASGVPNSSADPYAPLRDPATLQACVARLTDVTPTPTPLFVDFALFKGQPAVVIVLPAAGHADRVDAFIVGTGCGPAKDDIRQYLRVPAP